jgi:hypothetical protein
MVGSARVSFEPLRDPKDERERGRDGGGYGCAAPTAARSASNLRQEPVALPGDRLDEDRLTRVIAESRPHLPDAVVQALVELDVRAIGPDGRAKRLARDERARLAREDGEHAGGLGFERDAGAVRTTQFRGIRIKAELFEPKHAGYDEPRPGAVQGVRTVRSRPVSTFRSQVEARRPPRGTTTSTSTRPARGSPMLTGISFCES